MKRSLRAILLASDCGNQVGTCVLVEFEFKDGLRHSFFVLCCIWLLTFPTFYVPYLNLVLVPLGLLGGVIIAYAAYCRRIAKRQIPSGESICPKCLRQLKFSFPDANSVLHGVCPKCGCCYVVRLKPDDQISLNHR